MSGPWEEYQQTAEPETGPWTNYTAPVAPTRPGEGELSFRQGQPQGLWDKVLDTFGPDKDKERARASNALVYSEMLGIRPSVAYDNHDEISSQLNDRLDSEKAFVERKGYGEAFMEGLDNSLAGMMVRGKTVGPFESSNQVERWINGFTSMAADLPVALAGSLFAGGPETPAGLATGFGLTQGLRRMLVDRYNKGEAQNFGELVTRMKDAALDTIKGEVTGYATGFAGKAVPYGYKAMTEAATMTTVGKLLEGQIPTAQDFVDNAVLLGGMHLGFKGIEAAKGGLQEVFAKTGKHPAEVVDILKRAAPLTGEEQAEAPGLKPAIKVGDQIVPGEEGETHPDIEKKLGVPVKPVTESAEPASDHLKFIRDRIALSQEFEGLGKARKDEQGNVVGRTTSPYPEWFQNKGYKAKDSLNVLDKAMAGEKLTAAQEATLKSLVDSSRSEFEQSSKVDIAKMLSERGLVEGDKIKIGDEWYEHQGFDKNGDVVLKDGRTYHVDPLGEPIIAPVTDIKKAGGEGKPVESESQQSERGFVDPEGKFLNREQSEKWVQDNEPDVHSTWQSIAGEGAEFHSEDYNKAKEAVSSGNQFLQMLANEQGSINLDPAIQLAQRTIEKLYASNKASKYGTALRTFFTGERDSRIAETNQFADELKKLIPDYKDQEALSLLRDFKNKMPDLQARRARYAAGDDENLKKIIPVIDRALNPSPALLQADQKMTQYFDAHLNEGKQLGFLNSDIPNEEYITHLLEPEEMRAGTSGMRAGKITRRFQFAKERTYPTILDALEKEGVNVKTFNAIDAMTIYGDKHATAAATKIFTDMLKNTNIGKWGFAGDDNRPADWVELAPGRELFRNRLAVIDKETGEPRSISQNLYVPEVVQKALAPIIDPASIANIPGFKAGRIYQAYIKSVELGLSVFHMKALNITAMNNEKLSSVIKSYQSDMDSANFKNAEVGWIKDGLTTSILGRTVEAYRAAEPKTFPSRMDVIRGLPGIKQIDHFAQSLTHETFDVIQRKFKVMDASLKDAAWIAKNPGATEAEHITARQSIAKEVNAAYGGLQWENLGINKNTTELAKAIMLAPDWCVDAKTRAMTKTGWKYYHELNLGDEIMAFDPESKTLQWSKLRDRYINENYSGKLVRIKNYGRSILMTPDHKCYVRNFTKQKYEIVLAKNLQTNHLIPRCAEYPAPLKKVFDDFLVMMVGWIVTDGYVKKSCPPRTKKGKVYRYGRIVQSKPATVTMLKNLGLKWTVDSCSGNHDKFVANFQRHVFNIPNKIFEQMERERVSEGLNWEFLSKLTVEQRELLYDTMMLGDGTGQHRFCGKEKEVFYMTMLQTLMGKPTTFYQQEPNCWRTRIIEANEISCWGHSDNRTEIDYEGTIWCPTVDTGFWLAEREGMVFITGNTFSNVFNLKYAFEGGPAGAAARKFWIKSAITGIALTEAASILMTGQGSKHPTEMYLGKDKDGREIYTNMFFAGAPKDFTSLITNVRDYGAVEGTAHSIASKLGPLARTGMYLASNRNWMGQPIVKREEPFWTKTGKAAGLVISETAPIPFSISNIAQMLMNDKIDYSMEDFIVQLGGSPPRHEAPYQSVGGKAKRYSIRSSY